MNITYFITWTNIVLDDYQGVADQANISDLLKINKSHNFEENLYYIWSNFINYINNLFGTCRLYRDRQSYLCILYTLQQLK